MIFNDFVPEGCTCVWLRVTGDTPGFVLHQLSSTCTLHANLRWYQPTLSSGAGVEFEWVAEKGAEE